MDLMISEAFSNLNDSVINNSMHKGSSRFVPLLRIIHNPQLPTASEELTASGY